MQKYIIYVFSQLCEVYWQRQNAAIVEVLAMAWQKLKACFSVLMAYSINYRSLCIVANSEAIINFANKIKEK